MYSMRCGCRRGFVTQTLLKGTQLSPGCGSVVTMPTWSNSFMAGPPLPPKPHRGIVVGGRVTGTARPAWPAVGAPARGVPAGRATSGGDAVRDDKDRSSKWLIEHHGDSVL